ncbi:HAD family hydrolase [Gordonia westfalica]|uniref:Haloacid dehalogenase superfamily, subfamily IA, variant 3 with third motif having DD or ED n=1 Tax=Gordonia westfalica TaxID=158898 RepID=A0A1H2HGQ6_9ACTN|nr:HAD family phosphatase [Gordonia westfalica]SDU31024.1 haloacid dehalogenase superfamily, subfamily IA, variant 3 with third motif having DD or ED [Gordonia westfalica]
MTDTPDSAFRLPAAVLWDMDGTLLDSEPIWEIAMTELAAHHGIAMTPQLRESTLGNSLPDALAKLHDAVGIPAEDRDPAADGRRTLDRVTELFQEGLPWRPGALEALELIAGAGIPMALVTNTVREAADVALGTIGRHRFATTVCGDEVAVGKPAPDPYMRAAELLGLPTADCLAVEDSPTGAEAATAAGCPTLVVESAAPVQRGPLRVFRRSLVGMGLDDVTEAWTGRLQPDRTA